MPASTEPAETGVGLDGVRVWLSEDELLERLRLRSYGVVDEIYDIAKQQLDDEDKRDAVLTTKANSILGVAGLSLTVAFTLGAFLLQHRDLITAGFTAVAFAFSGALLLGLLSSLFALHVLLVSRFEYINERTVFGSKHLREADEAFGAAWDDTKSDPRAPADGAALSTYRRTMTAHLWGIYQRTFEGLEKKANSLRRAQICYFAFIGSLMVIGVILGLSVARGETHEAAASSARADAAIAP